VKQNAHLTDPELVDELIEDLETDLADDLGSISVSTRDWTVETIISQIRNHNIDLNPDFQRRNAWNDVKRSRLIESLIWGIPIPQIVLAQDKDRPKSFIVIDGKQRLLTVAGFFDPRIDYWKKPRLTGLTHFDKELNGVDANELSDNAHFSDYKRRLLNADIRCTIISNYESDDVLYEIFLRMNTASTKLSTQELRQVLHRGWFANWLIKKTSSHLNLHDVLGIEDSDERLVDVEVLLRCISVDLFSDEYRGDMRAFLDKSMSQVNARFTEADIERTFKRIDKGISNLTRTLGGGKHAGRRPVDSKRFETRFNRALFEVEQYYFSRLPRVLTQEERARFRTSFAPWMERNRAFASSIESTTKSLERTQTRFREFAKFVNKIFGTQIASPF
jgi:hypothetical protein